MAEYMVNILKPSVNNLTVRVFMRAAGLDFEEQDVWGKTTSPEYVQKYPAHLTPMIRGIYATLYARISKEADFQALFEKRYAKEPFVDVLPAGSHPETRSVRAANVCRIAIHRPPEKQRRADTIVVLSVIDNLVKGASGQAVQNMNLMFGLPETAGLGQVPVVP